MKLNKTQIEAIAAKAVRDIRTAFEAKCEKARKSYSPSEAYLHAKELFNKQEALSKQLDAVNEELREVRKIYDVCGWSNDTTLLNAIMDSDLKISSPEFSNIAEDIRTDLTINTIDSSFDPYKFIEDTVSKYVNS
jgi:vacuolar-type H+-ATPase subunit E/Vma4